MEDDGVRDRVIAALYLQLADAYRDNNINGVIISKSRIEKEETHKANEEYNPLYSHKKGKVLSFSDKVLELNEMYDDLMFDLADNSNESIKEIKTFTAEEVMKFNKRVTAKIKRNAKHTNDTD